MGVLEGLLELAPEESHHHGFRRRGRATDFEREVLSFRLGRELYAIDILRIREILRPRPVTEVPRTPDFVLGVLSVRGEVIPLVDLRLRLGLAAEPESKSTRILIVRRKDESLGLLVDEVHTVVRLQTEEIEPRPNTLGGLEEFVAGIGRPAGRKMLILLNLDAVLGFVVGSLPTGGKP